MRDKSARHTKKLYRIKSDTQDNREGLKVLSMQSIVGQKYDPHPKLWFAKKSVQKGLLFAKNAIRNELLLQKSAIHGNYCRNKVRGTTKKNIILEKIDFIR